MQTANTHPHARHSARARGQMARRGQKSLAQRVMKLRAGEEVDDTDEEEEAVKKEDGPLHEAVRGGDERVVTGLLENGASIDAEGKDGYTALHYAAQGGNTQLAQLLMSKGADKDALNEDKDPPLYVAVCCGKVATALALLAAGADVSFRCGRREESVLHSAVYRGHVDITRAAIERGADADAVNSIQQTPLHIAALNNEVEAIDVLMEAGANLEARSRFGTTPLVTGTVGAALDAMLALLKHGADVNSRQNRGETALFIAANATYSLKGAGLVEALLRSGADETILNNEGKSAADVVGTEVENQLNEGVVRVRQLLAKAPAERAWRRRSYLVMCRARPDMTRQMRDISSAHAGVAQMALSGCNKAGEASQVDEQGGGDWAVVVAKVLGLQEEGVFRRIVGYL